MGDWGREGGREMWVRYCFSWEGVYAEDIFWYFLIDCVC